MKNKNGLILLAIAGIIGLFVIVGGSLLVISNKNNTENSVQNNLEDQTSTSSEDNSIDASVNGVDDKLSSINTVSADVDTEFNDQLSPDLANI